MANLAICPNGISAIFMRAAGFLGAIERMEKIDNIAGRIMSFAGLRYYQNTTDAQRLKFMSDMQAEITEASSAMVFFDLEVNRIDDALLDGWMNENAALGRYKPMLRRLRAMKPHQLSDDV